MERQRQNRRYSIRKARISMKLAINVRRPGSCANPSRRFPALMLGKANPKLSTSCVYLRRFAFTSAKGTALEQFLLLCARGILLVGLLDPQELVLLCPKWIREELVGDLREAADREVSGDELLNNRGREERRAADARDERGAHAEHLTDLALALVRPRAEELDDLAPTSESDDDRNVLRIAEDAVLVLCDEHLPLVRGTEVAVDMDEEVTIVEPLDLHLTLLPFP